MSTDWNASNFHARAPDGAMRAKCPWTAMRLNNSHTAKMIANSEELRIKAASTTQSAVSARDFTPKDLELFQASEYQVKSCFRGYDKITVAPNHGTLPKWDLPSKAFLPFKS